MDDNFSRSDYILNYKPVIEYIEPAIEDAEIRGEFEEEIPPVETIDDLRDRTKKLVSGFRGTAALVDLAQERIDQRVESAGGVSIKLNPQNPSDYHTIAAMKRRFPDKEDPTVITYEDYKDVLDCINKHAPELPSVKAEDIDAAKQNPFKTDFGGLGNQMGENRAENSAANVVKPLDLDNFQKEATKGIFDLMTPLITSLVAAAILTHCLTKGHLG